MKFIPAIIPPESFSDSVLSFLFSADGKIAIPNGLLPRLPADSPELYQGTYLGTYEGTPCYVARVQPDSSIDSFEEVRGLFSSIPDELYSLIGYASQILTWRENHRFCSRCGTKAEPSDTERAMVCPSCKLANYPRISPSMIVAVTRGNELLMARGHHFPPGLYSVVAGFVEPGETLEQCVAREVMEETGLKIKNIQYLTSQPWPFPHSIMIGFKADYAGGEIRIDPKEIEDAGWYTPDDLPQLPSKATIARKLIDDYLARQSR
ncbi:NAD(+) diphosphatase [Pontiellaceae bacterium B12219]|nr:NAD(+) diphosphatase [Pontiellaceae bacterium B12219]